MLLDSFAAVFSNNRAWLYRGRSEYSKRKEAGYYGEARQGASVKWSAAKTVQEQMSWWRQHFAAREGTVTCRFRRSNRER